MIARGVLGRLAQQLRHSATGAHAESPALFSPDTDFVLEPDLDFEAIRAEAQTLADQHLAPLASLAVELATRPIGDAVDQAMANHAKIPLQAAAYAALGAMLDGFRRSELVDEVRALHGLPALSSATHRNVLMAMAVEHFRHGFAVLLIEVMRGNGGTAGGLN